MREGAHRGGSREKLVVTISGPHGVGKSTYAQRLAQEFGLKHFSAGFAFREVANEKKTTLLKLSQEAAESPEIDRMIDEMQRGEAEKGGVIIDSLLSGWICRDVADIAIYLKASLEVRIKRIAQRDGIGFEDAKEKTLKREEMERRRFIEYYGYDIYDMSPYDLVVDTSRLPTSSCVRILKTFISEFQHSRLRAPK